MIISREMAFIYCVLGTVAQVAHTFYLLESISSLNGSWKVFQAVLLSIFISSSLLYFVAIADNKDESEEGIKEYKKVILAVNLFTVIEILINIYYYSRHLIIDNVSYQIFDFVFAILVSCLIPITIKLYSSSIRAKSWIAEFEDAPKTISIDMETSNFMTHDDFVEMLKPTITNFEESISNLDMFNANNFDQTKIDQIVNEKLDNLTEDIDKRIEASYANNQDLFLKQFENKAKIISQDYLTNLKS